MKIAVLTVDDRFDRNLPQPLFGSAPSALFDGFKELGDSVEVHIISAVKRDLPGPTKLAPNIFFHTVVVPKWGFLRTIHQGAVRAINRKLKEIQPDVVHAQGTERWCAISGAFADYPKVLTIHGNLRLINRVSPMRPYFYWKMQELLEVWSIPRFDAVVCITNYTRKNVSDLSRKSCVIPNAVESFFFDIIPQPVLPLQVLIVANVQERKNQNSWIDAIAPLIKRFPFSVRLFGSGPDTSPFGRGFSERMHMHKNWCYFGGIIDRQTLRLEFSKASILVLPSLEDNCPMSVLEAMASGVPVIAANVGGVPDLIQHGSNGLLCDPLDAKSMHDTLERLLVDGELRKGLSRQAREDALSRFHPKVIARRHVELYQELVSPS